MKRIIATFGAFVLVMTLCITAAAAKAYFSGTWILDKSKSEGLPPGMDLRALPVAGRPQARRPYRGR